LEKYLRFGKNAEGKRVVCEERELKMRKSKKKSFKDAAFQILKEAGEPLSYKEIAAKALEQSLIVTGGKTPDATMGAQLYWDIKNNKNTKFKKVGKGTFALKEQTASVSSPLLLIENQNEMVRKALQAKLLEMDPYQFEFLIGDLLQAVGYEDVEVTKRSGDGGVDLTANLTLEGVTNVKTAIQVKRYKIGKNIPGRVVTQIRGSAEVDQRGLVISTSDFTKDAVQESKAANKMPVSLINGEKLLDFLMRYGVGIKRETIETYSIDNDYFEGGGDTGPGPVGPSAKNKVVWPLPGGQNTYVDTLLKFLKVLDEGKNTRDKLTKWYMDTFDAVNSTNTAYSYVHVPKYMGLIQIAGDKVSLSPAGKEFLKKQDYEQLYRTISDNIIAFDDIVEFLANEKQPQSLLMIRNYLLENFDVNWTTNAQVTFRVIWLINLGKIEKTDDGYIAK
jgi:restriction system protein